MQDKPFWFSRHAKNRMRRDKVAPEAVEDCVTAPDLVKASISGRMNYWKRFGTAYLRVTIAEDPDQLAVVSVVVKGKTPDEDNL